MSQKCVVLTLSFYVKEKKRKENTGALAPDIIDSVGNLNKSGLKG